MIETKVLNLSEEFKRPHFVAEYSERKQPRIDTRLYNLFDVVKKKWDELMKDDIPIDEILFINPITIEESYKKGFPVEDLEHDIIVRMPPRKRYTIELEVKSIKRAKPRIVEPELT